MNRTRDTEEPIGCVVRQAETGTPIGEICRKNNDAMKSSRNASVDRHTLIVETDLPDYSGISEQTVSRRKKPCAGMGVARCLALAIMALSVASGLNRPMRRQNSFDSA